ncbi:hypothetical protein Ais01nite_73930 [Asanoa ishikariensis]|uniref:Uncharacterized protein n=1 Tax=Asanoa ishikariensis TaxID=137265 RepID=A0A1H3UTE5_9ACTN|nr:hypothetical protein [Asanoa ishikariensis]GIF69358.1 hypothetical protein Ais01nite_73930 [Asanoa ishikariensis]SDZ65069.1 hypothetical protein SAMN05421684_7917 [Asanoa ishikariensis]
MANRGRTLSLAPGKLRKFYSHLQACLRICRTRPQVRFYAYAKDDDRFR